MEDLKTVYIDINEWDEITGMFANSFVADPAVGISKLSFSEELGFVSDNLKQNFMGVSLLADTPIRKRHPKTGEVVNMVFTKEVIEKIVKKFVTNPGQHDVTYNHNGQTIPGVKLVEHFIYDPGRIDLNGDLFPGITPGSWVTTYHVEDVELFKALDEDPQFTGFSVEIKADLVEANQIEQLRDILNQSITEDAKWMEIVKILTKDGTAQ